MKIQPETILSKSICQYLDLLHVYYFHVPSEGKRSRWEQMQFKANGGKPGVADLVLILPGRVVFVELKTATGRQSAAQKEFQTAVELNGHEYHIWRSLDDAVEYFEF
jgi:hypothetical protein